MIWYTDTCDITVMSLLYRLYDMAKCVCYMDIVSNDCFMVGIALTGGHYKMNIISGVRQPEVGLDHTVSVMYGSIQYSGYQCCITSLSG
jgi:hypothetical protein